MSTSHKRLGVYNDPRLVNQHDVQKGAAYPNIPDPTEDNIVDTLSAIKQTLEILTRQSGDKQYSGIMADDLEELEWISLWENGHVENLVKNRLDYLYGPRSTEMVIPLSNARRGGGGGGSRDPSFVKITDDGAGSNGVYAWRFSATNIQELFFTIHFNSQYTSGTDIDIDLHWAPTTTNTGNVIWGIEYAWVNTGGAPGNTTVIETAVAAPGSLNHTESHITVISGVGKRPQSVLIGRFFRNAASASDTYNYTAYASVIDVHSNKTVPQEDVPHA